MKSSFVEYYHRVQVAEWESFYVDYARLKDLIRTWGKQRRQGKRQAVEEYVLLSNAGESSIGILEVSQQEGQQFRQELNNELAKATAHYRHLYQEAAAAGSDPVEDAQKQLQSFAFCVANMIAVRQLLLRYNAFVQTYDGIPMHEWDVQDILEDSLWDSSSLHYLFFQTTLLHCSTMTSNTKMKQDEINTLIERWEKLDQLVERSQRRTEKANGGQVIFRDRFLSATRQYLLVGMQRFGLALEPSYMMSKGKHLKQEMRQLEQWYAASGTSLSEDADSSSFYATQMDPENVWPLILNLLSCFLLMMNIYIIEPSSAYYANALGSSDALSGMILGAGPWFALVSSIFYSYATNFNYKNPMLISGVLLVTGNILYGAAYSYESIEVCIAGRALVGLGAPRIINRRYVADATPFALRTIASAGFALMTALGAALGPGVAILLDLVPVTEFVIPGLGMQTFNGLTGPGFFMALCWFVYLVAILVSFKEPTRSGLDELKQREELERVDSVLSAEKGLMDTDPDDASSVGTSGSQHMEESVSKNSPMYCIKHINRATAVCMTLIFMKRIALESIVGSTSIVTKNRYAWNIHNVGTLHLVNGTIVIPVSILAGWLSRFHKDRYLASWFIGITIAGMLLLIDYSDIVDSTSSESYNEGNPLAVGPIKYIAGSLIAFSGIEACESYVSSLMSKVVSSKLAVGTFNSGLLATLVGTSGRAVGDLVITFMGLISIRQLLNLLVLPGIGVMILSLWLLRRNYDILAL